MRAIALRAGVTAGLIRHYFPGKEDLVQAAYAAIMGRMTEHSKAALGDVEPDPRRRLAAFLDASLEPPVIDARVFSVWASFSGRATAEPSLSAAHRATIWASATRSRASLPSSSRLRGVPSRRRS